MKNLIGRADSKNQPANFTWDEINKFMANIGQVEFDYDSFKQAYDTDPALQSIVHRFDDNGVELKSKNSGSDELPSDADPSSKTVAQMAKRSTNKNFG